MIAHDAPICSTFLLRHNCVVVSMSCALTRFSCLLCNAMLIVCFSTCFLYVQTSCVLDVPFFRLVRCDNVAIPHIPLLFCIFFGGGQKFVLLCQLWRMQDCALFDVFRFPLRILCGTRNLLILCCTRVLFLQSVVCSVFFYVRACACMFCFWIYFSRIVHIL